jgi:hypothetical protein
MYPVGVIVAHLPSECKGNFQSLAGGQRASTIRKLSIPEESLRVMASSFQLDTSAHTERHYAVAEIAEMWNLSPDKVRELFENEPGVLVLGERSPRHKRRYVTLRIPRSVVERVHYRLSSKLGVR